MTADTFLFNAGSLFFAGWILVIGGLTLAAFGRDLLPAKSLVDADASRVKPDRRTPPRRS